MAQKKTKSLVVNAEADKQQEAQRREQWERGWQAVDRIRARNADKDPDEVLDDVTRVVEEVRQERYERQQREAHDHRGYQSDRERNDHQAG